MSIQWYPGHMHKAQKQIKEVLPQVHLIIEVLDARIPYSSENPAINALRGDKPCIKILNKVDLADPVITQQWQAFLEEEQGVKTLPLSHDDPAKIKQLPDLCRKLLPETRFKSLHAMIMGVPNVGKSTLINTLAGKVIANTGNEPAVTKQQQRINLRNGIILLDTPGFLWPKIENEHSGYRLAATGAIRVTAMDYEDVAFYTAKYLLQAYPERLQARYQLDEAPNDELELLEAIASKRGGLRAGGRPNLHKASEILLTELRAGTLGPISLETPEMKKVEEIEVAEKLAAKEEKKNSRKAKRKIKR